MSSLVAASALPLGVGSTFAHAAVTPSLDPTRSFAPTTKVKMKISVVDGPDFVLEEHRGQPVLMNFFASWCPACRDETPDLVALDAVYRDRVVILGIDYRETDSTIRAFRERFDVGFPIARDPQGGYYGDFGAQGFPTNVLFDADGTVVRGFAGSRSRTTYTAIFDALLAHDREAAFRLSAT